MSTTNSSFLGDFKMMLDVFLRKDAFHDIFRRNPMDEIVMLLVTVVLSALDPMIP